MDPRCRRKSVQTRDTVRGTFPTVSVPLFIATANGSSLASFAGTTKPFSNERRPYLLVDVKSSDSARRHLQTNPTMSPASFAPLQLPYIREYFTREYFNTTVPSNREFKNAKNAKIANPRNINPAKIKAHTVYPTLCAHKTSNA